MGFKILNDGRIKKKKRMKKREWKKRERRIEKRGLGNNYAKLFNFIFLL